MSRTSLRAYRELADWYDHNGDPSLRDRFLVLAAFDTLADGDADEAERLRARLLLASPHHLLKPYASLAQAAQTADVQLYVNDLRASYPPPVARQLLEGLRAGEDPPGADRLVPATAAELDLGTGLGLEPTGTTGLRMFAAPPAPEPEADPPGTLAPFNTLAANRPSPPPEAPRPAAPPPPPPPPPPPRPKAMAPPPGAAAPTPEAGAAVSAWVSLALFVTVVGGGLALAGYTLARPFLP